MSFLRSQSNIQDTSLINSTYASSLTLLFLIYLNVFQRQALFNLNKQKIIGHLREERHTFLLEMVQLS